MKQNMTQLNELIEITRDGQHFYQHAIDEVKDVELQHLFRDMAQAKTHIIQALSVKVAANQEEPAKGGTTAGKLREAYADTKARLSHSDAVYIDQLDQTEERILAAFEDALTTAEPDVKALLAIELPKIRACHERIHNLNHSGEKRQD
ncbi:ferritin-like domain-containing protein [Stutzerimonas zhaodongensis]|uniref:ferritin-like domain-containing protein n=1 Tax=Stutzerimonas TaxID=2901164 RepID=UPI00388D2F86